MARLWRTGIIPVVVAIMAGSLLVACQPQAEVVPTLVSLEQTPTPTSDQPPTVTPTLTPEPTITPEPTTGPDDVLARFDRSGQPTARIEIVHTAPDVPAIDVYIAGVLIAPNLSFGGSSGQIELIAGEYRAERSLRVVERGEPSGTAALAVADLNAAPNTAQVAVFSGTVDALAVSTFQQALEPLTDEQSRLNFIHAVPRGPDATGVVSGVPLTTILQFGQSSGGIVVNSGSAQIVFQSTTQNLIEQTLILRPFTSYTVLMIGRADDLTTLRPIILESRIDSLATARVVNLLRDDTSIEVTIDGMIFATGVNQNSASLPDFVTTGERNLTISDEANEDSILVDEPFRINPGETLYLLVMGTRDDALLYVHRESFALTPNDAARVTFVNALPDAPLVSVGRGEALINNLTTVRYGQGITTDVLAGSQRVFWQRANLPDTPIVEDTTLLDFQPGISYLYILTGQFGINPLLFTEDVGINSTISLAAQNVTPTAFVPAPTRIRIVNGLLSGQSIQATLNGQLLVSNLPYAQGTGLIEVDGGGVLQVQTADGTQIVATTEVTLLSNQATTVFVYGQPPFGQVLTQRDAVQGNPATGRVRFVNLTADPNIVFGLARGVATDPVNSPPIAVTPFDPLSRPTIPIGVDTLVTGIAGGSASNFILGISRPHDLLIVDEVNNRLVARLRSVSYPAGTETDLIAIETPGSLQVQVFSILYPPR